METYARVTATRNSASLVKRNVTFKTEEMKKYEKYVKREGESVKLIPPAETTKERNNKTITYRIQDRNSRKLTRISVEDIEKCLGEIMDKATYVSRGKKYGTVEVRFATSEEAASLSSAVLRAEDFTMLPTYKGRRGKRIKIPNIPPEIKTEWLVTAILGSAEDEPELGSITETNIVNWKEFSVELRLMATIEDIERVPFQIEEENGSTISVIVERRPNCYLCGARGHIKAECPLYEFTVEKEIAEKEQNKTQSGETTEEEQRERGEKEQEKGKNSALKEKEDKEKETTERRQEKGKGSTLKEKETTEKEQKIQGRETIEKELKREQRQEKGKGSTLKEKENKEKGTTEKEQKTQGRETTDKELKIQEKEKISTLKEKENKEGKKRERDKPREENKEATSPKRKTREITGWNWHYRFYGAFVIHRTCPEMIEIIKRTKGHSWVRMGTEFEKDETGALIHEDSVDGFIEAAGENVIDHWMCRLVERPDHVDHYDHLMHKIELI